MPEGRGLHRHHPRHARKTIRRLYIVHDKGGCELDRFKNCRPPVLARNNIFRKKANYPFNMTNGHKL